MTTKKNIESRKELNLKISYSDLLENIEQLNSRITKYKQQIATEADEYLRKKDNAILKELEAERKEFYHRIDEIEKQLYGFGKAKKIIDRIIRESKTSDFNLIFPEIRNRSEFAANVYNELFNNDEHIDFLLDECDNGSIKGLTAWSDSIEESFVEKKMIQLDARFRELIDLSKQNEIKKSIESGEIQMLKHGDRQILFNEFISGVYAPNKKSGQIADEIIKLIETKYDLSNKKPALKSTFIRYLCNYNSTS